MAKDTNQDGEVQTTGMDDIVSYLNSQIEHDIEMGKAKDSSGVMEQDTDDEDEEDVVESEEEEDKPVKGKAKKAQKAEVADDQDDEDDDSEDDEEDEDKPKLSKRAARRARREAEKEELRQQLEQERIDKEQAQAALAAEQEAAKARRDEAIERMGPEEEFQRRHKALLANELSYEERDELMTWQNNREVAALVREDLRMVMAHDLARQADTVSKLPGVDRDVVLNDPSFASVCKHFYEAGKGQSSGESTERVTALSAELDEALDQISALETEIKTLKAKTATAVKAQPITKSGNSSSSRVRDTRLSRDASPDEMLNHYFKVTQK